MFCAGFDVEIPGNLRIGTGEPTAWRPSNVGSELKSQIRETEVSDRVFGCNSKRLGRGLPNLNETGSRLWELALADQNGLALVLR